MRHNKKFNHLGRQSAHRKAMLANMAASVVKHKRIETTVAKAKALKIYLEPVITKSKEDSTHSRRVVFSYLRDKDATTELFRVVAPKIADRPGGYLRILRTGFRLGDAAEMCILELVDFNETYVAGAAPAKGRTRRGRGGAAKPAVESVAVEGEEGSTEAVAKPAAKKVAAPKHPAAPKAAPVKGGGKVSSAKKGAVAKSTATKKG